MTHNAHQERPSRTELGRVLMAAGVLTSDWAPAYANVPRSAFLPDLMWPFDMETGKSVPVSKSSDQATWQAYADSDVPIVTQWDDGQHAGVEPGSVSTSSASMPSVVFRMLHDLDVQPGNRTLEIGTGTGWNAALLAHRNGVENVITVEVDEAVSGAARSALARCGLPVHVVHGDGSRGFADGAPYDRIIATAGTRVIPFAWVEQCRPQGVIVAPWGTHYGNGDAVVRLTVSGGGEEASGRFTGPVEFMKLRSQRLSAIVHADYVNSANDREKSKTSMTESELMGEDRFSSQSFAIGLRVRNCVHVVAEERDGALPVWFYGLTDRSWACVVFRGNDTASVWQSGPRRLWEEIEAAYRWWEGRGKPGHERFGLTVTAEGQAAWLDAPADPWPV